MAETTTRKVETVFTVSDQASTAFSFIGSKAASAASAVAGLSFKIAAIGTAGAATAIGMLSHISSEFEDTRIAMAGTLSALKLSGSFADGMRDAREVMGQIQKDAAALPGEADDYISVFRAALPQIQGAFKGNLTDLSKISDRYTAIATTFGIDSAQAGRDLSLMLAQGKGKAGADVRTFQSLLPFITNATNGKVSDAKSFNALSQEARGEVLQKTFATLQPMLDASAQSFSSLIGGLKSSAISVFRDAGEPVFEVVKGVLAPLTGWVEGLKNPLLEIGQKAAPLLQTALSWVGSQASAFGDALLPVAGAVWNAFGEVITSLEPLWDGLRSSFFDLLDGLEPVIPELGTALADAVKSLTPTLLTLGEAIAKLLPVLASWTAKLVEGVSQGVDAVSSFFSTGSGDGKSWTQTILDDQSAGLGQLQTQMDMLPRAIGGPGGGGGGLGEAFGVASDYLSGLTETVQNVASDMASTINALDEMKAQVDALRFGAGAVAASAAALASQGMAGIGSIGMIAASLTEGDRNALAASVKEARRAARTPSARGGTKVHNDFRNSRFSIEQKFDRSNEPDRIATALVEDLQKVSEQRLSGGLGSLFSAA